TVAVPAELALAVVQMEERGRLARRVLELVEDLGEALLRRVDVVTGREQMAGVEAVTGTRSQLGRNVRQDVRDLGSRAAQCATRAGRVLDEQPRRSLVRLERLDHRARDALRRLLRVAIAGRAGMEADT